MKIVLPLLLGVFIVGLFVQPGVGRGGQTVVRPSPRIVLTICCVAAMALTARRFI